MKKITALFILTALLLCLCSACTSKTPDVVASEEADVTLEDINWSIPIIIEATGETVTYTMEQAETHELAKTYITGYQSYSHTSAPQVSTFILEGVRFSDVLEDLGVTDCSSITVTHNNVETVYQFDKDIVYGEGTILGWIQNKKEIVAYSDPSYVGFGSDMGGVNDFIHSVKDITIHS